MNIFKRTKNNLEYAKWKRVRNKSLEEAIKCLYDEDDTEFRYWVSKFNLATKKCIDIDIK